MKSLRGLAECRAAGWYAVSVCDSYCWSAVLVNQSTGFEQDWIRYNQCFATCGRVVLGPEFDIAHVTSSYSLVPRPIRHFISSASLDIKWRMGLGTRLSSLEVTAVAELVVYGYAVYV